MKGFISTLLTAALCMSFATTSFAAENPDVNNNIAVETQAIDNYNSILSAFEAVPTSNQAATDADADGLSYPDYYGGSYMNDDGELVVQVTDDSNGIKELVYEMVGNKQIIFNKVKYSYTELLLIKSDFSQFLDECSLPDDAIENIESFGISQKNNVVQVRVKDKAVIDLLEDNYPSNDMLCYVERIMSTDNNSVSENLSEHTTRASSVSLEAGNPVLLEDSQGRLAKGSLAYRCRTSTGVKGFVSTCHDSIERDFSVYDDSGNSIGTVRKAVFDMDGVDASFVKMNSSTSISNYIYDTNHKLTNGEYVANLPEQTRIYTSGRHNTTSGKIVCTDATVEISSRKSMKHLVETEAYCEPGDSGGLVYYYYGSSDKKIAGVICGKNIYSDHTYYCRASKVNDALGVEPY